MSFTFKYFKIKQTVNAHKVGTDSMVLGAWTKGDFKSILDIGTGTGVLALMQAQQYPEARIIGIEPNLESCEEAKLNFENSPFNDRLETKCTTIQNYQPKLTFDLIICNPPYFVNSTLSAENAKNKARHTVDLPISDLYQHVNRLLSDNGQFSLIFPSNLLHQHLTSAKANDLFPTALLVIETEDQKAIRHIVTFKKTTHGLEESHMIVKYASGLYSKAYVDLTKNFHNKTLPFHE